MTVNVKTNNNGKSLAEISNVSNPNLLINTDFSKVIHQRGAMPFTTYNNAYGSCIDRWRTDSPMIISQESGYIRLKANYSDSFEGILLHQCVEMKKDKVPYKMTLSLRVRASKKCKYHVYTTNRFFDITTDWQTLNITFTTDEMSANGDDSLQDNYFKVWMGAKAYDFPTNNKALLAKGDYVDIQWIKLEVGDTATRYIQPSYYEELEKCKKYFMKYYGWISTFPFHGDNVNQYVEISPITMRTNPTVSGKSLMYLCGTNNDGSVTYINNAPVTEGLSNYAGTRVVCKTNKNLNAGSGCVSSGYLELDAEIY